MKIELINGCNELEQYICSIDNGKECETEWERLVIAPIWDKLCCYAPMDLSERKPKSVKNIEKLKEQVKILRNLDVEALKKEFEISIL